MRNETKLLIVFWILLVFSFPSCKDEEELISLDQISLNVSALEMSKGEVKSIIVTASPENASESVTWTSSDDKIAAIQFNENGLVVGVKAISLGNVILTAKNSAGTITKTVNVAVIVKVEKIALEEIPQSDPAQTLYKVVFTPADATKQTVTWSSSNPSVATVANGLIIAVAPGVTTITATSDQGGKTTSVEIAVSGNPPILGYQYCEITGKGGYHADAVSTSGADANINYTGVQDGNYELYESEKIIVQPGASFDLSVTQANDWSMTVVWIDWNGDKDFADNGERVQVFGIPEQLNNGPFTATINVPGDAVPNLVRMRVLTGDAWTTDSDAVPCGNIANSSTIDFSIEIGGTAYCSVSGTESYNADKVATTGGDSNIQYDGGQPAGNYEHFTGGILSVGKGSSFNLSVTQLNNWSMTVVWIDWNADGDFNDAGEKVQEFGLKEQLNIGPFTATINVPGGAIKGTTRMRILTGDAWTTDPTIAPCGEIANSTTKDFNVKIL